MSPPDPQTPDATASVFAVAEANLLADALGIAPDRLTARSREPLGQGSVAGFGVAEPGTAELTYFVDTSRIPVRNETGLAMGDPVAPEARVWLHPADPHLPALAPAAFGGAAETLLGRLGLSAAGAPRVAAYRPGRRAVLRVEVSGGCVWVKVVRPSRLARIVETHAALRAGGVPVPEVLGWSPEGLLVIADAVGTPAAQYPWQPGAHLDAVDAVRSRLAAVPLPHRAASAAGRAEWYAPRLRAAMRAAGEDPERIDRLFAGIAAATATDLHRPRVTVHGDLHYGQLFFEDAPDGGLAVSSVIDVDTAGTGDPADDAGAFIAHAVASALMTPNPEGAARVWRLADLAVQRWGADAVTRALTATQLAGHALGAFDLGERARAMTQLAAAEVVLAGGSPSSSAEPKGR